MFIRRPGAYGGIEVLLMDWLKYINYDKYTVCLMSTMDLFSEKITKQALPVILKTCPFPVNGNFHDIYSSWSVNIRSVSPDKIVMVKSNVAEIPLPSLLAAYVATRGNVYLTEHIASPFPPEKTSSRHFGFIPGIGLWRYRKMLSLRIQGHMPKRILAVSKAVKNLLLMYGCPEEKISIAYHGVDVSQFAPSPANKRNWRRCHNIPEDDLVFVSTARLSTEKRLERSIKAFDAMSHQYENLWFLIAGDGPLKDEIRNLVRSLTCRDRIRLLGHVEDIPELLQASDIFVLPSDREGLSVSLTEAMATGLLCIASDVSGSNEVIRDGENGFLVEPSDQGVYHGFEMVLKKDIPTRKIVADKARNTIIEHFEIKKSVANILGLLDMESI